MKRVIILFLFLLPMFNKKANAQIEVAKLIGKNTGDFRIGFGAFLKLSKPVSDAADITIEGGVLIFPDKEYPEYATLFIPVKLGYRYTIDGSGTGFYAEPQVGFNVYGINLYYDDSLTDYVQQKIKGLIWSGGIGYLFNRSRKTQFDLSVRYESVHYKGGNKSYIGLRLSNNFSFGKRDE